MKLVQITYLLFSWPLVDAAPPLIARFLNITNNATTGNISNVSSAPNISTSSEKDPIKSSSFFNVNAQPMFPTSGNWTSLKCEDERQPGIPGSVKWTQAGCTDAWNQLMAGWNAPDREETFPNHTFTDYVWASFGLEETLPDCSIVGNVACSTPLECINNTDTQTNPALAGVRIMNSIVEIHVMFSNQDDALNLAYESMSGQMLDLASTFAPTEDTGDADKVLGIIDTVLGVVSAGSLSTIFKGIKVLESITEKQIEVVKGVVEAGIEVTSTTLDNLPTPQSDEDTADVLTSLLSKYYNKLRTAQLSYMTSLLYPVDIKGQQVLSSLVQSGLILNLRNAGSNNSQTVYEQTVQMLWGKMITTAWATSAEPQIPFILRIDKNDHTCNTTFSIDSTYGGLMSSDTASSTLWCDPDGNSFFLLRANFDKRCTGRVCPTGFLFEALSGGDSETLNGDMSQFGGLTLADIIISSWGGFIQNGKKNGYEMPTNTSLEVTDNLEIVDGDGLPFEAGIRTPGFFDINICLDPQEAEQNILYGQQGSLNICGTIPQIAGSTADINAPGQFTPGLCKVHVIQYQRNEGDENLLNTYQLQVNVFDNSGLEVGDATKQNAAEPLVIVDSVLPYNLLVAAQGPDDSSTVNFWYSDQWWTSNDQAHHCNFGLYDSGYRQGDCDFNCPLPSDNPPASATITQAVPTGAIAAVGGTLTFSNSFTTPAPATPTTTPTAAPTPTYATGWCGMHIVQYQKNEGEENPTFNFELEVTLFDAKQKPIGDSGIVQAPKDKPVSVAGLVSPLQITTSALDDDPLAFAFDGHQWTSSDCSVGSYDSGTRNMDCGFSC